MNKSLLIGNVNPDINSYLTQRGEKINYALSFETLRLLFSFSSVSNLFLENSEAVREFCELANDITNIGTVIINGDELSGIDKDFAKSLAVFIDLFPEYTSVFVIRGETVSKDSDLQFMMRKFYEIESPDWKEMYINGKDPVLKKHHVVILGSCVARDSMEINNIMSPCKVSIGEYIGRNSIAAMNSNKFDYPEGSVNLPSAFLTKCITYDLEKTTAEKVVNALTKESILLLDFMDERFDLIEVDDALITNSWDYRETALCKNIVSPTNVHAFYSSYKIKLWKAGFNSLVEKASKVCSRKNIIVFAPPMTRVLYCEDKTITFDESRYKISEYNEMLDIMKGYLKDQYPDIHIIEPLPWMLFCDYRHRWGGHPYHYNNYLYMYFSRKIKTH